MSKIAKQSSKLSSDVVIAGVGGQGTVLAAKLLAEAAILDGRQVRTAETIGMAQRGGSVTGHVRMSFQNSDEGLRNKTVMSPLVPANSAELLIGFEPAETLRNLELLREGGAVVTTQKALVPVSSALGKDSYNGQAELNYLINCRANGRISQLVIVDGDAACGRLSSTRVLNVVLLGAALALGVINISDQAIETALNNVIKPNYIALNRQALREGRAWVSASTAH